MATPLFEQRKEPLIFQAYLAMCENCLKVIKDRYEEPRARAPKGYRSPHQHRRLNSIGCRSCRECGGRIMFFMRKDAKEMNEAIPEHQSVSTLTRVILRDMSDHQREFLISLIKKKSY